MPAPLPGHWRRTQPVVERRVEPLTLAISVGLVGGSCELTIPHK